MSLDLFGDSNVESMLNEMENEKAAGKFQSAYWSPKQEGISPIRFLPQLKVFNEKLFYQKVRTHYVGGKSYMCLNQTLTDKNGNVHEACECPICTKSKQIYKNAERGTDDWNLAGSLRAKDRYISRVIVRNNKDEKGNDVEYRPVFYEFGMKIHEYILNCLRLGEVGDVFSLKAGRDFNLSRKGTGRNTDYSASSFSMKQSPVFSDTEKLKALVEELPKMNYSQLVTFESDESLRKILAEALNEEPVVAVPKAPVVNENISEDDIFGVKNEPIESTGDSDIDDLLNSI